MQPVYSPLQVNKVVRTTLSLVSETGRPTSMGRILTACILLKLPKIIIAHIARDFAWPPSTQETKNSKKMKRMYNKLIKTTKEEGGC